MISANSLTLQFGKKPLFEDINIKFTKGNCYGIIGANGAGKSTFLKILSGELEPTKGDITKSKEERIAVLKQNHFEYENYVVIDVVIMGYQKLYKIMKQKEELYEKKELSEKDGIELSELEAAFLDIDGWNAHSDAAWLLNSLGVPTANHEKLMSELENNLKIKVLLAQALFANPDILLLDEPTNNLDIAAINWLENFLADFQNTVILVSHDRHFLNQVCTHIVDIDYGKMQLYVGNYDFWYQASQLAIRQLKEQNKKKEAKVKEMTEFIQRFSANASKSRQATSRKRLLEKITIDDIKPSSRKYPYIDFKPIKSIGQDVLQVKDLELPVTSGCIESFSFIVNPGDKIAFIGNNDLIKTMLFKIITGETKQQKGSYKWGLTASIVYYPKDNSSYFTNNLSIVDWLRECSEDKNETFIRSFLGRMLFSGDDSQKPVNVLSGGEKARCMFAKMMLSGGNILILDEPTNHLDLESITSLNNGLIDTNAIVLFTSHDHQFIQTIANRIIEILPKGIIDKSMGYDEYINSVPISMKRASLM